MEFNSKQRLKLLRLYTYMFTMSRSLINQLGCGLDQ